MSTDAIVLLREEHKELRRLFREFEAATTPSRKGAAVRRILRTVSRYGHLECAGLYPEVRTLLPELERDVLKFYEEHHVAEVLCAELAELEPAHDRFTAKTTVLIESVTRHLTNEEQDWFPQVRKGVSRKQLQDIGAGMLALRKKAPARKTADTNTPAKPAAAAGRASANSASAGKAAAKPTAAAGRASANSASAGKAAAKPTAATNKASANSASAGKAAAKPTAATNKASTNSASAGKAAAKPTAATNKASANSASSASKASGEPAASAGKKASADSASSVGKAAATKPAAAAGKTSDKAASAGKASGKPAASAGKSSGKPASSGRKASAMSSSNGSATAGAPMAPPKADVVDLLIGQHMQIRDLFVEVESAQGEARAESFRRLVHLLAVHETAEEQVVHPLARLQVHGGAEIVDDRLAEEHQAKETLSALEKMGPEAPEFPRLLDELRVSVLEHAGHEEAYEFRYLRRDVPAAELQALVPVVKAAEAIAPTHPHPGVESATANNLAGPALSLFDRTKDLVRDLLKTGKR